MIAQGDGQGRTEASRIGAPIAAPARVEQNAAAAQKVVETEARIAAVQQNVLELERIPGHSAAAASARAFLATLQRSLELARERLAEERGAHKEPCYAELGRQAELPEASSPG